MNSNTANMEMCRSYQRNRYSFSDSRIIKLSIFVLLMIFAVLGDAEFNASSEQKLKVALIYKLTKFVEWPNKIKNEKIADEKTTDRSGSFGVCLMGMDAFGSTIDVLKKRNVDGQPISVRRFTYNEAIDNNCSLVYINVPARADLELIIHKLRNKPVLTISEHEQFVEMGGIVQLVFRNNRIAFNINHDSSVKAGLSIAAPLLELAIEVKKTNGTNINEGKEGP